MYNIIFKDKLYHVVPDTAVALARAFAHQQNHRLMTAL